MHRSWQVTRLIAPALCSLLFLLTTPTPASPTQLTTAPAVRATLPAKAGSAEVVRAAYAEVIPQVVTASTFAVKGGPSRPQRIPLELFDGESVIAVLERYTSVTPETISWVGRIEGVEPSRVVMTVSGNTLHGMIRLPDRLLRIRSDGEGHRLEQIEEPTFGVRDWGEPTRGSGGGRAQGSATDDGTIIDVMVVYSPQARDAAQGGHATIRGRIAQGIAVANEAMAASGVIPRLRLAYTGEVDYDDVDDVEPGGPSTPRNGSLILEWLQGRNDGVLDEVHPLRDEFGADLVVLGVRSLTAGLQGSAYAVMEGSNDPGFESQAFAVVRDTSLGGWALGHELGHLMGSHHTIEDLERAGLPYNPGAFPYSFAYLDPQNRFVTIMGSGGNINVPRLTRFSTPNGQAQGAATGSADADNARSINGVRSIVANFRSSADACPVDLGRSHFCSVCGPCRAGEGDCEPGECEAGLACVDNVGPNYGYGGNVDVCEVVGAPCTLPPGDPHFCADPACGPCGAGEGDCDGDAQCQTGLTCVDNVGANYGYESNIDVCEGTGGGGTCNLPLGHPDYCADPACGPCGIGEADCEAGECLPGLTCVDNVGPNYGFGDNVDVCEAAGVGTPTTLVLEPVADTFVANDWPNTNFGTDPELRIRYAGGNGSGHPRFTFLLFEVPTLTGPVVSATLRLRTQGVAIGEAGFYDVDIAPWGETELTWNNWGDPAQATLMRSLLDLEPGTVYEVDVTEAINGSGFVTIGIGAGETADTGNQDFDSRETAFPPTLTVVHE